MQRTPYPTVAPQEPEDTLTALNKAFISAFFLPLTQVITDATHAAVQSETFTKGTRAICLLPKGVAGITRSSLPFTFREYDLGYNSVKYDPNAVCLVGGSALQAYGIALQSALGRNIADALPTADIDAVWWPHVTTMKASNKRALTMIDDLAFRPLSTDGQYYKDLSIQVFKQAEEYVPVSLSPLMGALANAVAQEMKRFAQAFLGTYARDVQTLIQSYIPGGVLLPTIETKAEHVRMPGVWNVSCSLQLGPERSLHLLDLAIHDGASSQKSMTLEDKRTDFVYQAITPVPTEDWQIHYLSVGSQHIPVPSLKRFITQQWMALTNRLYLFWQTRNAALSPRVQTHYMRIREMVNLLQLLRMYAGTTGMVAAFEHTVGNQFAPLEMFINNIVNTRWFHQAEWIASCPMDVRRCQMTPADQQMLASLCQEGKVLLSEMLCASRGGKHTTRRQGRRRRARRLTRRGT